MYRNVPQNLLNDPYISIQYDLAQRWKLLPFWNMGQKTSSLEVIAGKTTFLIRLSKSWLTYSVINSKIITGFHYKIINFVILQLNMYI